MSYVGCQQIYEVESPVLSLLKFLLVIAEANSNNKIIIVTTVHYVVQASCCWTSYQKESSVDLGKL